MGATADRPVLLLNLDETSIPLWSKPRKGYLMFGNHRGRKAVLRQGPGPSLSLRRSYVSLVALLCDDPAVQPLLPQVFVTNEHVLSKADVESLNADCRPNVFFARRRSSWANAELIVEIVKLLAVSIPEVLRTHRVVLHMDTARSHLHTSVVKACTKEGIFLMYVPASTTAWLQPLDAYVFSSYKRWVGRELEKLRLAGPTGSLPRSVVMGVYSRGLAAVLEAKSWRHAFEATGLRGQCGLSKDLMARLRWAVPPPLSSALPSLGDLQVVYPRGACIPLEDLFELPLRCTRPVKLVLPQRARLPAGRPSPPLPPPEASDAD